MITISEHPFDISEIINEYPPGSIERQLLNKMSESTGRYQYDNLNQLKFELRLRKEIVNASEELNKGNFSFASFRKSRCNPKYWDRTANGGFRLKKEAEPAAAIKDILINGKEYATECATAMMIVYYIALLNVFPEDRFNKVFSQIYLMNWHLIDPLLKEAGTPDQATDILIGDRGYFNNPDVNPETPEWQGENVIVLPDELYYGHGIGITTAKTMIQTLNRNRKVGAIRSAYFMDTAARPDFKRLADIYYS
jgi:protein-glutamine gamma-glutamyltransferase